MLQTLRSPLRFEIDGTSIAVCPTVLLMPLVMLANATTPIAVASTLICTLGLIALLAGKLRAQIWLANKYDLKVERATLFPYVAGLWLGEGARGARGDVHALGLCVLFGAWAVISLVAQVMPDPKFAATLERLAIFALITGGITALPGFGLDGGQILRLISPGFAQLRWLGMASAALAGVALTRSILHDVTTAQLDGTMTTVMLLAMAIHLFFSSKAMRA